ncbi:TAT-variant-translocated molybdopterin oxidoreductase, partial [bacterium]|nr:TAT-variant-translocated molybdopterin oxidoreductase [bacterium]
MSSIKHTNGTAATPAGQAYWRSLEELAQTPEFLERMQREFPEIAVEQIPPHSRRDFLKFMGASLALAGLALSGCRWPEEKIAPYANRPAGTTPGQPLQYATAMELGGAAVGLLVTSFDGRPIKIEGNPKHPGSLGAAGAWHQASILELYDPSRTKQTVERSGGVAAVRSQTERDEFLAHLAERFAANSGRGLYLLFEETSSPSTLALRRHLQEQLPESKQYVNEPISRDAERAGLRQILGRPYHLVRHYDQASVLASFDDDFLAVHPNAVRHAHDFAAGRRVTDGRMNRLYVVESGLSVTGMNADHRIAAQPAEIAVMLEALATELINAHGLAVPLSAMGAMAGLATNSSAADPQLVQILARDLAANAGRGLVTVGHRQPAYCHALAYWLNAALGNLDQTITLAEDPRSDAGDLVGLQELTQALANGAVDTLVIAGGNPVYTAPADLDFAQSLVRAGTVVHLALHENETSAQAGWLINRAHYLESWGDALAWDGTYSIVQPLIAPLYGGLSETELLARLLGSEKNKGYDITRETFAQRQGGAGWEAAWLATLRDGVAAGTGGALPVPAADYSGMSVLPRTLGGDATGFQLVLAPDGKIYDGRFANNGWLQELPEAITKVTWDNAACLSIADARERGIEQGDLLELAAGGRSIIAPAYLLPGQAAGTITLALGYGRDGDLTSEQNRDLDALHPQFKDVPRGVICRGVGVSAYQLSTTSQPAVIGGVAISKTGTKHTLACTQDSHIIDTVGFAERERRVGSLVREANLDFYRAHPDFAQRLTHHPPLVSLWKEHAFDGHRWAMAIDLNSCIGCGACIVACQAENNIPVVGKRRVEEGREMHWIRVDRYFSGAPDAPEVVTQPVACHHCELAPCEQVCPVAATVHSQEGLNDMVYNRCVGTRYCANNCPYKVRR